MKGKYKYSISRVYGYCRWAHKYPPDDWCWIGINKWWCGPEYIRYGLCFFGFEIRIVIDRKYIPNNPQ